METRSIVLAVVIAAFAIAAGPSAGIASDPEPLTYENYWKRRDWKFESSSRGHLRFHAGTNNFEAVLDDPEIKPHLKGVFGVYLPHFLDSLLTHRSPMDLDGSWLVLQGTGEIPNRQKAILVIQLMGRRVQGALSWGGMYTVFSDQVEYYDLPPAIQRWVRGSEIERFMYTAPEWDHELIKKRFPKE